ncbi:unnamed protein product [Clonostachys byssicola]|uniref:Uncharacterized protein n=1 Tax=Clonostachys byssicola TaxID=160290 RepID=A0A9N9ULS6_9HYPO|nr:unnamed protein product [Clonostachys byssicola]
MDDAAHQMYLGIFIAALGAYWVMFAAIERIIKLVHPVWYEKHKSGELRYKMLFFVIIMILRATFGTLVVLPSCIMAARETPWELGQTMTPAGHVCVIGQIVPWASELLITYENSTELYLHHVYCTVIYFNTVAAPNVHMIKALYVQTATQLGDICLSTHSLGKHLGYNLKTSRVLYYNRLIQIASSMTIKVTLMFYALGRIILTPYTMWDLIRATCLLFLAFYTIRTQIVSFVCAKIALQPSTGPVGLLFQRTGFFVSRFNITLAASIVTAIVAKVLLYAANLSHPLGEREYVRAWVESITSITVIYLLISLSNMLWKRFLNGEQVLAEGYRSVKRGELFLRLGSALTALLIHSRHSGNLMARHVGLSSQALSTAVVFTFLGWDLLMRFAIYSSVGGETRGMEAKDESAEAKIASGLAPRKSPKTIADNAVAAPHLRMIWVDFIIITAGLYLPARFSALEKSYTLFLAHAVIQVLGEMSSFWGKGGIGGLMFAGSPARRFASLKLVLAAGQNLAAFSVCRQLFRGREQEVLWVSLAVALFSRLSSFVVVPAPRTEVGVKAEHGAAPRGPPTLRRRLARALKAIFTSGEVYSVMVITIIQLLSLREIMRGNQPKPETPVGFENFRTVLKGNMGVFTNVIAATLITTSIALPCGAERRGA